MFIIHTKLHIYQDFWEALKRRIVGSQNIYPAIVYIQTCYTSRPRLQQPTSAVKRSLYFHYSFNIIFGKPRIQEIYVWSEKRNHILR